MKIARKTTKIVDSWLRFSWLFIGMLLHDDTRSCTTALSLETTAPATIKQQQQQKHRCPIQRVAIIGSGIAGLSVAHALSNSPSLRKSAQDTVATAAADAAAATDTAATLLLSSSFPEFEVSLFDSRASFDTKSGGAGVQLNGGLSVLGKINPDVLQAVMDAGLRQTKLTSKCRRWEQSSSNDDSSDDDNDEENPMDTLLQLDIRELIQNAGGDVTKSLLQDDGTLLWISIMRNSIQQALLDTLPRNVQVQFGKFLTNIQTTRSSQEDGGENGNGGGAHVEFADGSTAGPFDLIVGCDGIKSACKEFLERGEISKDESRREGSAAAIYSGVRIKYAVRDGKPDDEVQPTAASLSQNFGNGAYVFNGEFGAGAGPDALPAKCTYLVYQDPDYIGPFYRGNKKSKSKKDDTASSTSLVERQDKISTASSSPSSSSSPDTSNPADENADWSQNIPKTDLQAAREKMMQQARDAKIGGIDTVVPTADRIFELGVYFHNPFSWSGWSKEYEGGSTIVLCGDAAHAFPPFLGQGANQAIQDAYCLATKLYDYNVAVATERNSDLVVVKDGESEIEPAPAPTTLRSLLKEYERTRWSATFQIFWKSVFLGYLETGGPDGIYAKFRDVFFKTMGIIGVARIILLSAAVPKV